MEVVWGGGERGRGRGRGRSVTWLYGHETSSSPFIDLCFFLLHRYQVPFGSLQPPTRSLKGKGSSSPPPPRFTSPAMPCSAVANIVTGDGGKSLCHDWHSQASNSLSLSLLTVGGTVPSSRLGDISLRDGLYIGSRLVNSRPTICGSGCCIACST